MRAESFCATPGERFSFTGEDGLKWEGTCKELRPVDDNKFQFRGVLTTGKEDLIDTEICGQYDSQSETLDLIN